MIEDMTPIAEKCRQSTGVTEEGNYLNIDL